jgi:tRNA-2-methylthio-N6-dimethylallyladenosine synthase
VRLPDPVPPEVAQTRLEALQQLQRELTLAAHRARVGELAEVLVEGPSRRGGRQGSGRDAYHRVVNFAVAPDGSPAPGELVPMRLVEATPHSLIGEPLAQSVPAAPLTDGLREADVGASGPALGA